MRSSKTRSAKPAPSTAQPAASPSRTNEYKICYASSRVEKMFGKAFTRMPKADAEAIKEEIKKLKADPKQAGKKIKALAIQEPHLAQFRLRVGNFRVLYDTDDEAHKVVLLLIARRNENTYK